VSEAASIGEKINRRGAPVGHIDARTCRPDGAYPKYGTVMRPTDYVHQFSEALGLTPAPTRFGDEVVTV